jgi:MEMO1 family protein
LVGSFHEYFENRESPDSSVTFLQLIESLQKALHISGRKPLFIASVDLAHIGRKFGDDFDAAPALSNLRFEDRKLIDSIERLDKESFFQKILDDNDKYKICGTSPIYSLLSLNDFNKASFLKYNQWNDIETKSAVSFASFAFYN